MSHQERVRAEFKELIVKIEKLRSFLKAGIKVAAVERQLLEVQLGHMVAYAATLSERIALYDISASGTCSYSSEGLMESAPFKNGEDAYRRGMGISDNPYVPGYSAPFKEANIWLTGYERAHMQAKGRVSVSDLALVQKALAACDDQEAFGVALQALR